jgi:nitric oxide reductase NorD protein
VTIDRHGADYLKHMYGPASYTVLDDVRKLPLNLADIYRRLTR